MTRARTACLSVCVVITSSVAAGQSPAGGTDREPVHTVIERVYDAGNMTSWRVVRTRSDAGAGEAVVETVEARDVEGRMSPRQETVTETVRTAPDTARSRREVFGFAGDGRRRLLETTESQQDVQANGDTNAVHDTFTADLNGRVAQTSRRVERTRAAAPGVRETETTTLMPTPNEALGEVTRIEDSERRIDPGRVQYDSTRLVRDVNGRWQATESQGGEARDIGATERLEEQTIQRLDMNGRLAVVERTVARRSSANERDDVIIETQTPFVDRLPDPGGGLAVSERVRRTTTKAPDGGLSTVEEVEGRNPAAPGDPLRVIRRTVTTVRPLDANRWVTERQVFERDVNGRMQRVVTETEDSASR